MVIELVCTMQLPTAAACCSVVFERLLAVAGRRSCSRGGSLSRRVFRQLLMIRTDVGSIRRWWRRRRGRRRVRIATATLRSGAMMMRMLALLRVASTVVRAAGRALSQVRQILVRWLCVGVAVVDARSSSDRRRPVRRRVVLLGDVVCIRVRVGVRGRMSNNSSSSSRSDSR